MNFWNSGVLQHFFTGKNKRYTQSIQISKDDKMYKDVIETAAESKEEDVVNDMLEFFVDAGDKECFCAGLFTCFELISPDKALELAWRHNLMDMAMPFMIQYLRLAHLKTKELETKIENLNKKATGAEEEATAGGAPGYALDGMGQTLMLSNVAYYDQGQYHQQQYQQQYQQQQQYQGQFQQQQQQQPYPQQQQYYGAPGMMNGGMYQ